VRGVIWSVVHVADLFHRRLALHYVVRIENTLVMMTHGIASCSLLLSFFLHSPTEEKTLEKRCICSSFSHTLFPESTPGEHSLRKEQHSDKLLWKTILWYTAKKKGCGFFLDSHNCNFLLSKL